MSNPIENNAYRILGLDTNKNQKEIFRRYKEIINLLKIEDSQDYDIDINLSDSFRSEGAVKDALKRIQSPKTQIKEYFFWFNISDKVDEEALDKIKHKEYLKAIETWKLASNIKELIKYSYKKNIVILYCILLIEEDNVQYLKDSLKIWKELIYSDENWEYFYKLYQKNNEMPINLDIFDEFKDNVIKEISEIYTDLYQHHNNPDYIKYFEEIFGRYKKESGKKFLQPLYQIIFKQLEELQKIEITDEKEINQKDILKIKNQIDLIKENLDKLSEVGAYDDAESIVVRNHTAKVIREIAVSLFNNTNFFDECYTLLKIAEYFCGTESLKNQLQTDISLFKKYTDESLDIEIPGTFSNDIATFTNRYVEYLDKKIFYKDVTGISYHSAKHSIDLTPTSQYYDFIIKSGKEEISLSFSSKLYIGNKEKQDLWYQLISLSKNFIEPLLIKKMIKKIFEKNEKIIIGDVVFDKNGYSYNYKKVLSEEKKEEVLWKDRIYVPEIAYGFVTLFKDMGGKGQLFKQIPMSTINAIILPGLIQACVDSYVRYSPDIKPDMVFTSENKPFEEEIEEELIKEVTKDRYKPVINSREELKIGQEMWDNKSLKEKLVFLKTNHITLYSTGAFESNNLEKEEDLCNIASKAWSELSVKQKRGITFTIIYLRKEFEIIQNYGEQKVKKIIVVDDNPEILYLVRQVLEDLGKKYNVICTNSGEGCIRLLEHNQIPDLILSNIMMPGMNGWELFDKIKEDPRWNDIPFIFLTARRRSDERTERLADDYITKPFEIEDLLRRVEKVLEESKRKKDNTCKCERCGINGDKDTIKKCPDDINYWVGKLICKKCYMELRQK
jgi:CheY-like chemotaxis protein